MNRNYINMKRDELLKKLRKGIKGRPYSGIKHYNRDELNILRNKKLEICLDYIILKR